ncbi:MAG: glycosyltransferase family A protein [Bacteroidota bacterium]
MGKNSSPKISLVTVAYNRAHLIERSIKSVLKQTFKDWELIIVDNGSTDNTREVLKKYKAAKYKNRIRIFHLEENRRYAGGVNFGMDQIRGEWFSWHDDDDEIIPEALETLLKVPEEIDPTINAVTCNCIDTTTKKFSGHGLSEDGYLSYEDIMTKVSGEFWGITKTELLGDKRLNEELVGFEATLWNQIDRIANRYYLHKPLRIWYTDHAGTISKALRKKNVTTKAKIYRALINEGMYWEDMRKYQPSKYLSKLAKGMVYLYGDGDADNARLYEQQLKDESRSIRHTLLSTVAKTLPPGLLKGIIQAVPSGD